MRMSLYHDAPNDVAPFSCDIGNCMFKSVSIGGYVSTPVTVVTPVESCTGMGMTGNPRVRLPCLRFHRGYGFRFASSPRNRFC